MPMVLFKGFQDEPGLRSSNARLKSHGTFLHPASEVHLTPFFHPLLEGPNLTIHACNKCNSKYTMRSTTRVQVLELWPVTCGSFCIRKRRKATTWLREEEYNEWVMGLHWISANPRFPQRSQQRGFAMRFCSERTEDALSSSFYWYLRSFCK
jgi:hypothetical protein